MKKVLLLLMGMVFFGANAQGLGIKVEESKIFKQSTARVQNDYILPTNDGGFITISTKRSGFLANPLVFESYATLYNNKLEKLQSKTFKLNKGSIKGAIKGAFVKEGNLFMINMEVNNRKRYISFKRIRANIADKSIDEKEFFRVNHVYSKNDINLYINYNSLFYQKIKYYSDVNFYNPKVFIKFSKNNKFFTIIYRDFTESPTRYIVTTFNDKFEKIYTKTIIDHVNAKTFFVDDVAVDDNNGSVYVVAKIYEDNPHLRINAAAVSKVDHYSLYKLNVSGIKKLNINTKGVVEHFELFLSKSQLSAIGFYRNSFMALNDIDGLARININTSIFSISNSSYKNFNKKLVSVKFLSKHKRSKNHKMIIRNKFLLDNGDVVINAEDLFIPHVMKKKDRELTLREYVGDMFSIKVSNSGNIIWAKKMYKLQMVKPRLALHSFFSTLIGGTNYILFTDSKTKEQPKDVAFYLKDKDLQNLNGVKIYSNGGVQKGIVKKHERTKFRLMPIEGIMISKNEAIIPAKDHHLIRFYKLTF